MSFLNSETWKLYHYIKDNKIPRIDFSNGVRLTLMNVARNYSKQPVYRLYIPKGESCVYPKEDIQVEGLLLEMLETLYLQSPQAFDE